MYKLRYLVILVFLCIGFSGCWVNKPYATSVEDIDPSGTGYEHITKPFYRKKVKTSGAIFNVVFTGAGAAGGYIAGNALFNKSTTDANGNSTGTSNNPAAVAGCAVGGAAVGYLISRMFMKHSHTPTYISTREEYKDWLVKYDKRKRKDYLFIEYPDMYDNSSMMVLPKKMETKFKPRDLRDLRIFAFLFPGSVYTDSAIIYANPMLSINDLDTLIGLYPDRASIYTSKVEYVGRFKTESDFKNALDKYADAQNDDSTQIKYAQVIQTYPFAKDFLTRYPHSLYFDPIYQQIYTKLPWDQLSTIAEMYTTPASKANQAKIQYFEMAATFHDLLNAVTKYSQVSYVVKPEDNLNTEGSATNILGRLVAYKPVSAVNNIPKVESNLPEEFLMVQNKTLNIDGIDTLYNLANRPWVQTDSATDIIDTIRSNYAKNKNMDQPFLVHLAGSYDSGILYKHDGTILKGGKIMNQQDIIGPGVRISSNGRREIGAFADGQLNGRGKLIIPRAGIIEEGIFKDGRLNDVAGKMTYPSRVDSGIFRDDQLDNQGMRTYNNGNQYEGNFLGSKFSGDGTFTWSGGKKWFKGKFVEGRREGKGELFFDNGYVAYGMWKNDCPDGEITIEKGVGRNSIEWSTKWTIKGCMIVGKSDPSVNLPFSETEILEKLPIQE